MRTSRYSVMKTLRLLVVFLVCMLNAQAQQNIIIYADTFTANSGLSIQVSNQLGAATGSNGWVVNNSYNGLPVYGNTPDQSNVVNGTINGAPHSYYLHIHDSVEADNSNISNANWNPQYASDRFVVLNDNFCTLGVQDVVFSFFWIGEGNADAYGEVYYRKNGGPWQKTGQAKYNNQPIWKYEAIADTGFSNAELIQFGFRWVNSTTGTANVSWGIDDIVIAGTYNQQNAVVSVTDIIPSTVCKGDIVTIRFALSNALCDGTYQIQMSDSSGDFGSTHNGGVFTVFSGDTAGFIGLGVPNNVSGSCFRVRINRLSPAPFITGQASNCFTVINCPNSIVTVSAPVMTDVDTACLLSVIDVKFNSVGVFGPGVPVNVYTAQLSDANGSFASPYTLGTLPSDQAYPGQPGNISGLIPANVPPGCGYFIRVVSSLPAVTGSLIGPFCLTQCDILTNNQQDMQFCIPQLNNTSGLCKPLNVQINRWSNDASYSTCNRWKVELRNMLGFGLVDTGSLGLYTGSTTADFSLCMPQVRDSLPVAPGSYYMRLVSTCSNQPWNQTGTVVRVSIGAPDTTAPDITFEDSVVCGNALASATVSPFKHPPSDYEWASNILNNGNPFIWEFNPLLVDFSASPVPPDTFVFYVREKNFGCYGPYSRAALLYVNSVPYLTIAGPDIVCAGDTVVYSTGFYAETFYDWTTTGTATILNEGNNESGFTFSSLGNYTIQNYAVNECGSDLATKDITVAQLLTATNGNYTVCRDSSTDITVNVTSALPNTLQTTGALNTSFNNGGMFNISAQKDVVIDSLAVKFTTSLAQIATIFGKHGSYKGFEANAAAWANLGSYYNFPVSPVGQYTVLPISINQPVFAGDTFAFYVAVLSSGNIESFAGNGVSGSPYVADGNITLQQGSINTSSFSFFTSPRMLNMIVYYSTKSGLHYVWNTGDTTAAIQVTPANNGSYTVAITDDMGCSASAAAQVTVIDCTTSVVDNEQLEQVTTAPNPTGGQLLIKGINSPFNVTITDATGKQVLQYINSSTMLDISALPGGIYLLSISTDNRIFNTRIVLQK